MPRFTKSTTRVIIAVIIVVSALFVFPALPALAASCSATSSGNWSTLAWSCTHVPTSADDVIINNGLTISLDAATATINSLTILDGNGNTTFSLGGNSLTVTNDINVINSNQASNKTLDVSAGTLTIGGNLAFNEGVGTQVTQVTISTGTLTVNGNITYNPGGTPTNAKIIFSGAGTLNMVGNYPGRTTLTTASLGSVNFTGAGQTIPNYVYYNLGLSGSGAKTLPSAALTIGHDLTVGGTASATIASGFNFIVTHNLSVDSGSSFTTSPANSLTITGSSTIDGTLTLAGIGTKTFTGAVTIDPGGIYNETGVAAITNSANLSNNGTYIANTGTHTFNTGSAKTIGGSQAITIPTVSITAGTTFNSGTLNVPTSLTTSAALTNNGVINAATAMTIGAALSNTGTITVPILSVNAALTNNGTLNVSTTLAGASTITNAANATINYGGATFTPGLTAIAAGNVVNYNGSGAQTVKAITYTNLILNGSGIKSLAAGTSTNGNLSIQPSGSTAMASVANGATLAINNLTLGGVNQNLGTYGGTGSVAGNVLPAYFEATTGILNVTANNNRSTPIVSLDGIPPQTYLGGPFTVSGHTSNSDPLTLSYSVLSGPCVLVNGATFDSTGAGTCVIQVYSPATSNFEAGYAIQSVSINKAGQAALTLSSAANRVMQGYTTTLATSGGSGTGAVTFSVGSSTGCTVLGNILTVNDASLGNTCDVTATKAGDANYLAIDSNTLTITMALYQAEINKQFSPTNILPGGTSILSISLFNPNVFELINAAWSDDLVGFQPGIMIASPLTVINGCGGSISAVAGGTSIALSGGTIPPKVGVMNGQCTVTVRVTSTTQGNLIDTIPAGDVSANMSGAELATNTTPASATLQVSKILAPTVDKNFNPATVFAGVPSALTINIHNTDTTNQLTGVGLTDTLPANVTIATPPGASVSGSGCTATILNLSATAGASSLTFSGASLAAGLTSVCTIRVNVVSTAQGSYINFLPTGSVQTDQGVTNALPAQATLNVQQLNLAKAIAPASTGAGNISLVTITINKPTGIAYSGMTLTDTLPVNMLVSGTPPVSNSCGGSVTANTSASPHTVTISGGSMDASATSCAFTFNVTTPIGIGAATLTNTITAGSLVDDQGISNPNTVSAALTTLGALTATKSIAPSSITSGGTATVTIVLTNNNNSDMTGVSVTDVLPLNLVVVGTPPDACSGSGGSSYNSGTGKYAVTLTGGTVTHNSTCTFTFQVSSTTPGAYVNTIPLANICATGPAPVCATGNAPSGSLTVQVADLPITGLKQFGGAAIANIAPGGTSVLTIRITAPSDTALHNVSLTDILPAGVTTTNAVTKSAGCQNGTLSPGTGLSTISWTSTPGTLSINAGASCTLTVTVTSSTPGFVTNTVSTAQITDDEGRSLPSDLSASLNVSNFTMSKAFFPPSVNQNGFSRLVITLDNQNLLALDSLTLNDSLPAGMIVASAPNAYAFTDCGGLLTANGGSGTISLSGAVVPAKAGVDGICTILVDVKATAGPSTLVNTLRIAPEDVSAYLGASLIYPRSAASANLVITNLTITVNKDFPYPGIVSGGSAWPLKITLSNPNSTDLTGVQFTDSLPAGMYIAAPPNVIMGACSGSLNALAGGTSFSYNGGVSSPTFPNLKLPANTSCTLSLDVTMDVNGNLTNTIPAGAVTTKNLATNSQPASATLTNLGGVSIHKSFAPDSIPLAALSYSTLTLQIKNQSNFDLTNVGGGLGGNLIDQLPLGLAIADPSTSFDPTLPAYNTCGGTLVADKDTREIYLSSGYVPAEGSCTIQVPVTADVTQTAGCYTNTIPVNAITNDQGQQTTEIAQDILCILGNPALATTPGAGGVVGVRLQDSASLSGGFTPTGSVTFKLYAPGDPTCSGTESYAETSTVDGSFTAATSTGFVTNTAGTWHWIANYSGDANNSPASSACSAEPVTVDKASPVSTTSASPSTGTVGTAITTGDRVTNLGAAFNPTGSITFTLYSDPLCSNAVLGMSGSSPISGGGASFSKSWTPAAAGIYYWLASYAGDTNNNSAATACRAANEQIGIAKTSPTLTTQLKLVSNNSNLSNPIVVGTGLYDTAALVGGYQAGGTITYRIYTDNICSNEFLDVTPVSNTVVGGVIPDSANQVISPAGDYWYQAAYAGDANNNGAVSTCSAEPVVVGKESPGLATTPSAGGTVGITLNDTAAVSGGFSPTGSVLFKLFPPTDPTCSGPASYTETASTPPYSTTSGFAATLAGVWNWTADYSGDANNTAVSSACMAEGVTVDKAASGISTTPGAGGTVGVALSDAASLIGGYTPTGSVTFSLFPPADPSCTGTASYVYTDSSSPYAAPGFASDAVGIWHWTADYSGDANNVAASSACSDEPVTVVQGTPTLTTTALSPVIVSDGITDTAHLAGGYGPLGGTITFQVFAPGDTTCNTPLGVIPDRTVLGAGDYSSAAITTTMAGSYRWLAVYSGDTNNLGTNTACNDAGETSTVYSPSLAIVKSVDSVSKVSAGTWDVTYTILVGNTGDLDLSSLQVTDDLATTFPAPTTFTIQSKSSADFTVNSGYDGNLDINLLAGTDLLAIGSQGTITLTVRVVPTEAGPFTNVAIASAQPPLGPPITTPSLPVPVSFGPAMFDPPFGLKVLDASGLPVLHWTMVWINNTNLVGVNAIVHDPIPANSTYVPGSVSCTATSPATITTTCTYDGTSTLAAPRGQIIWAGTLGPDFGVTDPALAVNAIHIQFDVQTDSGTTSVQNVATIDSDLNGNGTTTDAGEQNVARASASWQSAPPVLPSTGFSPDRVTALPPQLVAYADLGGLWLEIPRLGLAMPIVGVPQSGDGTWDVSWLGDNAGWLDGTAYPGGPGNSVLTGHVWNAYNTPGPFRSINTLWYGDQVIIHASGVQYIYAVREVLQVGPGSVSTMLKHEKLPWITLVTCRGFDPVSGSYTYRVLVRAVLVKVK